MNKYTIMNNVKQPVSVIESDAVPELLLQELQDIYQDDPIIANVKMEISAYKLYGCRITDLHRCANHIIKNLLGKEFSILETDAMLDEKIKGKTGWVNGDDAHPIWDIIDVSEYVRRLNNKFNLNIKYEKIDKYTEESIAKLKNYVECNIPLGIKVVGANSTGFHFVSIDGTIQLNGKTYFRMKDTYRNYNGYTGSYIEADKPFYYEVFYV